MNFNTDFANDVLEWKKIYSLPFRTSLDTKSRKFLNTNYLTGVF